MKPTKKVLVCGSRNWESITSIRKHLQKLSITTTIIQGEAPGADTIAKEVAKALGMDVEGYYANWIRHGKPAGPIRNRKMLDQKPDLVIAFHPDLNASKGTADCVIEAKRRKIPVRVIGE